MIQVQCNKSHLCGSRKTCSHFKPHTPGPACDTVCHTLHRAHPRLHGNMKATCMPVKKWRIVDGRRVPT